MFSCWTFLVEKAESHVVILFLLFFHRSSSRSSRGSSGELAWIGQELLDHLSLLEGDVGDGGYRQQILHAVNDGVGHGGQGRVVDGQTDRSHSSDTLHEAGLQVLVSDVEDLRAKHGTSLINLLHNQSIGEGRDVEHIEQSSLGHTDLVFGFDQGHILDDLNCTLGNLGGDAERLEEGSFLRTHTGVLGGYDDIQRGDSASPGGSLDFICEQQIPDVDQLLVGENKTDVLLDVREQPLKVRILVKVAPDSF